MEEKFEVSGQWKTEPVKQTETVTFTYDLTDFDAKISALRSFKGLDMALALWSIKNKLYDDFENEEKLKDAILDVFDEYEINVDELVH